MLKAAEAKIITRPQAPVAVVGPSLCYKMIIIITISLTHVRGRHRCSHGTSHCPTCPARTHLTDQRCYCSGCVSCIIATVGHFLRLHECVVFGVPLSDVLPIETGSSGRSPPVSQSGGWPPAGGRRYDTMRCWLGW